MLQVLKKFRNFMPLLLLLAGMFSLFSLLSVLCCNEPPTVQVEVITNGSLPDKLQTDIPEFPYTMRNNFSVNLFSILNSARRNFNPVPPAYRTQDLSSLPLAGHIVSPVQHYFYMEEWSHFQRYLKYALPLRAGPCEV